jgi:hypothetical protein
MKYIIAILALTALAANAAVVVFTPSGGNTVSQSTSLYWNMLSNEVSTSPISGAPGGFNLSDHGDFHFDGGTNQIATTPASGDQAGETIPLSGVVYASRSWTSFGFAGTNDFGGTMVTGDTAIFGVRFDIAGETHYGWVSITEGPTEQTINSWGYETTPNTGIAAGVMAVPEPTSAVMLGASGLLALVRRRK